MATLWTKNTDTQGVVTWAITKPAVAGITETKVYDEHRQNIIEKSWSDENGNSGTTKWSTEDVSYDFDYDASTSDTQKSVRVVTETNTNNTLTETRTHYYTNDNNQTYLGGEEKRNGETIRFDANRNELGRSVDTSKITDALTSNDGRAYELFGEAKYKAETRGDETETTYYHATSGAKVGSSRKFTNSWDQSTQTSYDGPDGNFLGSYWSKGSESRWSSHTEEVKAVLFDFDGNTSNDDTTETVVVSKMEETRTWTPPGGQSQTESETREEYYSNDNNRTFLGAIEVRNGETIRFDANWNELGRKVDLSAIDTVLDSDDGRAFVLFGAAKYKVNSWSDGTGMSGSETTYYDASSGAKLGSSWANTHSYQNVTSTNRNYQDANGNHLGDEWSDGTSSVSNSITVQDLSQEPSGIDLDGDGTPGETLSSAISVRVEQGSETRVANGNTLTETRTHYYTNDNNQTYLGGEEKRNGETIRFDANRNELGRSVDTSKITDALTSNDGRAYELFGEAKYKAETRGDETETTYYHATSGAKVGSSRKFTNSWDQSTQTSYDGPDGNFLGSYWSKGLESRWSSHTEEVKAVLFDFDGNTSNDDTTETVVVSKMEETRTWTPPGGQSQTESETREEYYSNDNNRTFLGAIEVRNGETIRFDANWNELGRKVDLSAIDTVLDSDDGRAFVLFGAAKYKVNSWSDGTGMSGSETTYYDASSGAKLGSSWANTHSYQNVTSTNRNYQDANGNHLGDEWSDGTSSVSNSITVQDLSQEPSGIDLDGDGTPGETLSSAISVRVEQGSETRVANGNTLTETRTHYYTNDNNQTYLGGEEKRNGETIRFDANRNELGRSVDTSKITDALTSNDGRAYELFGEAKYKAETRGDETETTYYHATSGAKVGSSRKFTNSWDQSTQTSYDGPDGNFLGSYWSKGSESRWSSHTEEVKAVLFDFDGNTSNDDTTETVVVSKMEETRTWTPPGGQSQTESETREEYYSNDNNRTFLGAIEVRNGETIRFDANWNELGRKVDLSAIDTVLDSDDGRAFVLFGAAKYKVNSWSDGTGMSGSETTYYDASSGAKLGSSWANTHSYQNVTSTNRNYQDANGNHLGDEWSDGTSSVSNSITVQDLSQEPSGIDLDGDGTPGETLSSAISVRVEQGSETRVANGNTLTETRTHYYTNDNNQTYLGGEEKRNGETIRFDANRNELGRSVDTSKITDALTSNDGRAYELFGEAKYKAETRGDETETTYYHATSGAKVGSSRKFTNSWDQSTQTSYDGPDGNFLGSYWSKGLESRWSSHTEEVKAVLFDFDGNTSNDDTTETVVVSKMEETRTWTPPGGQSQTESETREEYYSNDNNRTFLGAIEVRNGETIRFDANWNELGRKVDLSAIDTVLDSDDGRAFVLFGAAKYKVNSWSDGTGMSGSETTYYDASSGAKLGSSWANTHSYQNVTSTNRNYQDANGNHLGDEWSDGTSSVSNSITVQDLSQEPSGIDLDGDGTPGETLSSAISVRVEQGSETRVANGNTLTETRTHYYTNDNNQTYLGGEEKRNGETIRFDANRNELGRSVDTSKITDALTSNDGRAYELFGEAKYKAETRGDETETTYYHATSGAKVGSSRKFTNSWDQSTQTSYDGPDGNFLGSYWSKGLESRWSSHTEEVKAVLFDFDGNTSNDDTTETVVVSKMEETRTWTPPGGQSQTESETREEYYSNDNNRTFLGAIEVRNGETIRFDANWNELGRKVDLSAIDTVLDSDDGRAFVLFGAAKYKVNSWSDGTGMSGSETTYYDASSGAKLGSSWANTHSYQNVTSTNRNYQDANGNHLGDEWSDGTSSVSNSITVQDLSQEPSGIDLDGDGTPGETLSSAISVRVEQGSETRVANGNTLTETRTHYYTNDNNQTYLGGEETRNGETIRFDANRNELGRSVDTSKITDALTSNDGRAYELFGEAKYKAETRGDETETTYYHATSGAKVGSSRKFTNSWDQSTQTSYDGPDGNFLGSYWSKGLESRWSSHTEEVKAVLFDFDGNTSNDDTTETVVVSKMEETRTWTPPGGQSQTESETREEYYSNDNNRTFLGAIEVRNGETIRFDANWNELGRKVDLSAIDTVLDSDDGRAFVLFGAAKYKVNSWSDGTGMSGSETTYYDASSGAKLGSSWANTHSYQNVTSTNRNYQDANGNHLGDEWSDGTSSVSNSITVQDLSQEPSGIDLDGDGTPGETLSSAISVRVEQGSETRVANGNTLTETRTHYYTNDNNQTYLGGEETRNGETIRFDANRNELGRSVDTSKITDALTSNDGRAYELFGEAKYKAETRGDETETTYYHATSGAKVGSSRKFTNSWDQSTQTSYDGPDGNFLGSYWSKGLESRWSSHTEEVKAVLFDFDGNTSNDDTTETVVVSKMEETRTWTPPGGQSQTESETREEYYSNDNNRTFLGAIEVRNGETIRFDANWNELGRKVDLSAIDTVLDSDDGRAFVLFGAAKYKVNSWSDGTGMSGSETTYYDASSGAKLGSSWANTQANGDKRTDYRDANDEHLGDEKTSSQGSEWNLKTVQSINEEPDWLDLDGNGTLGETLSSAISLVVREGSATGVQSGQNISYSYKNFYSNDGNDTYLGGSETRNGETHLFTPGGQFKTEGTVIDGYISGALVFADADNDLVLDWTDQNQNGFWDQGEGETWVRSNQNGDYNFTSSVIGNTLVAVGGIDTSTNQIFDGALAALSGGSVITPLTTVMAQLVGKEIASLNEQPTETEYLNIVNQSKTKVQQAFNLGNVDISNFDPFEVLENVNSSPSEVDVALNVQKASATIANIIVKVSQTGTNSTEHLSLTYAVTSNLATKISALNGSALNLTETDTITEIADSMLSSDQISSLVQSNTAVVTSNSLSDVVAAQKQIQEISGGNNGGSSGTTGPSLVALTVNEDGGVITITGTTTDAQASNILVGYEMSNGSSHHLSSVSVTGSASSGFTVDRSAVETALGNANASDAVKLIFVQGSLGNDGNFGTNDDQFTHEGSLTLGGNNGGSSGTTGPSLVALTVNEDGGVITITGTTTDAQASNILVGYEMSNGSSNHLSSVSVTGSASSGFTVDRSAVETALGNANASDAVKLIFVQGSLGNDGNFGTNDDQFTHEGSLTLGGNNGGSSGTTGPSLVALTVNEDGGVITITGTTTDAQASNILVGYEMSNGSSHHLSSVSVTGSASSGFTVDRSAVETALGNANASDAVKLIFVQGSLGNDGNFGTNDDQFTHEGSLTLGGNNGGSSGTTGPSLVALTVNEDGGVITITGTTTDAQASNILVGYEMSNGSSHHLSSVSVTGSASSGFTVDRSAVETALGNANASDAVKLIFVQGSLGNDGNFGTNDDQFTHEGSLTLGGNNGGSSGTTPLNKQPTGSISISGTTTEGQVLTVDTTSLADADGLGTLSYQWLRDGADISGATSKTYTLAQADVGAAVSTRVSYTDGGGTAESVSSIATQAIVASAPTVVPFDIVLASESGGVASFEIYADASVDPQNNGFGSLDMVINHDPTDMLIDMTTFTGASPLFGMPNKLSDGEYAYGAFGLDKFTDLSSPIATFDATILDTDNPIVITLSGLRVESDSHSNVSETFDFTSQINKQPTGSISISGTTTEGKVLTVDTTSLADADGLGTLSYQWLRDGADISGATSSTYTLAQADVGAAVSTRVSYTDGGGTAESVSSIATQAIVASAPTVVPFDIVLASESGGVASFEIYADASVDPQNNGFGSLDMVINHDPTDMLIDMTTFTGASPLFGMPNKLSDGEYAYGAFGLDKFTDLSTPIATFDATILDTDNPIVITLSGLRVESDSHSTVSETFDFTSQSIPGLKIEESGNVVTVSGTATGKLEVSVDASGVASFARYNTAGEKFTATKTVSNFYDKQLKGVSTGPSSSTAINEIELNIAGGKFTPDSIYNPSMTAEAVRYVIVDVPEANTVTIKGDLGTNAEKNVVVVRVADPNVGVLDTNNLKVDTSNLSNVATSDVFEIELLTSSRNDEAGDNDDGLGATGVDKDVVVFDYNTDISGFGLYQVQNGEASWKTVERDADGNIVWVIENVQPKLKYFAALDTNKDAFSNLPISLAELQANTQFVNSLNTGTLKIQIYPGQESELETFLSSDPALKIVGYKVVVETLTYNLTTGKFDSAPTDLSGTTIQDGIDAITFDGFVNTKDDSDTDLIAAALSMLPDQMETSDFNGDITYNEGIQLSDITADTSIDMTGILVGDVDGSYIA